jgi:hypothetical protein
MRLFRIIARLAVAVLLGVPGTGSQGLPGTPPQDAWNCPASHPIKGNSTAYSGESCIDHMPGERFYPNSKPERCYATEERHTTMDVDARSDKPRQAPSYMKERPYDHSASLRLSFQSFFAVEAAIGFIRLWVGQAPPIHERCSSLV